MGYTISWYPLRFTDFTYTNILDLLPKIIDPSMIHIQSWGFSIGGDCDNRVPFFRDGKQSPWEKTNRLPYTKEAMKALILMVEFGVTLHLDHDDNSMAWYLEALEDVHAKHPLVSYDQQKTYFIDLQAKKSSS
jgi:hypothetical protein